MAVFIIIIIIIIISLLKELTNCSHKTQYNEIQWCSFPANNSNYTNNNNDICIAPQGRNFRGADGGRSVVCANQMLK